MSNKPCCAIVVDDDAAVLASIRFMLEAEGLRVRTYGCAQALLEDEPPQCGCLILDQLMPKTTGLELLSKLRQGGVELPALLLTSSATAAVRRAASAAQIAVLEKPVFGEALLRALEDAMRSPRAERSVRDLSGASFHGSPKV